MTERLWFQNVVEGLFVRGLGPTLSATDKVALANVGLKLDKLLPAYSEGVMLEALRIAGPLVLPRGNFEEQQHELGVRMVKGYFDTLLGKAMVGVVKLVGPERGISRLDRNLRTLTNYLNARIVTRAERSADVEVEPVGPLMHFIVGILHGSGSLDDDGKSGATLVSHSGEKCVVRLSWG